MATTYVRSAGGIMDASKVIGCKVENPKGENLGKIESLMVDLSESRILYAILSFGGFMGMGDKLFPVPLNSFSFRTDSDKGALEHCILNVEKETLKNAPGYERDRLPDSADRDFASRVYTHYGATQYWTE